MKNKKAVIYITPDDFKNEYGIDLREALRNDDGVSDRAESFIASVTSHLKAWIDYSSFRRVRFDCLTDFQLEYFKKALLAQVYYTFKEGLKALGLSSGVDDEKGVIISPDVMAQVEICPAAVEYLSVAGIFNLVMENKPRTNKNELINIDSGYCYENNSENIDISNVQGQIDVINEKLSTIEIGAEQNKIERIFVNGEQLPVLNKTVNIVLSDSYATTKYVDSQINIVDEKINKIELEQNLRSEIVNDNFEEAKKLKENGSIFLLI